MTIPYQVGPVPVVCVAKPGGMVGYWIPALLSDQLKPGDVITITVTHRGVQSFTRASEAVAHRMVEIAPMPRELCEAIYGSGKQGPA